VLQVYLFSIGAEIADRQETVIVLGDVGEGGRHGDDNIEIHAMEAPLNFSSILFGSFPDQSGTGISRAQNVFSHRSAKGGGGAPPQLMAKIEGFERKAHSKKYAESMETKFLCLLYPRKQTFQG